MPIFMEFVGLPIVMEFVGLPIVVEFVGQPIVMEFVGLPIVMQFVGLPIVFQFFSGTQFLLRTHCLEIFGWIETIFLPRGHMPITPRGGGVGWGV